MSLASSTASASVRNGTTTATGPKISSRTARSPGSTGHSTVGGNQKPGPSGAAPRIATGASSGTKEPTVSRWAAEISGPISVASSSGSPTRIASTCSSSASMKASSAGRSTRMRERAQQSWPALPNTAGPAAAAAAAMSASANTMFADLPPSSSVTRLIVCAAVAAIRRPTSVEPVKATLATSGCSHRRAPQVEPGPATTLTTPSGMPASSGDPLEAAARSAASAPPA